MPIIKNKLSFFRLLILGVLVALSLFACGGEEQMKDLQRYVDLLKKAIVIHKPQNIIAGIKYPKVAVFQASTKYRDPFQELIVVYSGESLGNPLTAFPSKQYEYLGIISQDDEIWAIVRAPDKKVYQVKTEDRIGDHYGRITGIYADHVDVEERISSQEAELAGQKASSRTVSLPLKGENN